MVPPEKQKLMYKGKIIKETEQVKALDVAEGATMMLMGTAEGKGMDLENYEKKLFIEDMTPEMLAKHHKDNFGVSSIA